jgi:hypothetical protein
MEAPAAASAVKQTAFTVRETLGVPDVTSHSFRKTVATLIDDEGLSARIGADHLGHYRISMTQVSTWPEGGSIPRLLTCWTAPQTMNKNDGFDQARSKNTV